jgi:hypothetical protein
MGIFEKSIPKYVVNPVNQTVEVVPQEVYVDDIFDPIFNRNVRNAMRQKYGDGLYGVVGGYEEMLKNAWGGDGGMLGKGMGVLSTFGRSMEKADDLVLGLLTEGVEGVTGQGFDNPFTQIFSEDRDYTGKGLLASAANTFRGLAGTTVSEEDFGTAWNIPALGIELTTDVGILGGGLARKFAPAARELTSKQLFENLGKSDLPTTVGEIGQLMSNYDDLMTRVAIDATAPGLRPAFRSLKNRLGEYFATHSAGEWADAEIDLDIVEDETAPLEARLQAQERLAKNQTVQQATALFKEADEKMAAAPAARTDVMDVSDAPDVDVPDDIDLFNYEFTEGGAEEPVIDRFVSAMTERDLAAEDFANKFYTSKMESLEANIHSSVVRRNKELFKRLKEAQANADKIGWHPKPDDLDNFENLDKVRAIVTEAVGGSWERVERPVNFTPDEKAFLSMLSDARSKKDEATLQYLAMEFPDVAESLHWKTNTLPTEYVHGSGKKVKPTAKKFDERMRLTPEEDKAWDALQSAETPDEAMYIRDKYASLWSSIFSKRKYHIDFNKEYVKRFKDEIKGVNKTYADEVVEKLNSDDALIEALSTGEWSTNDATNRAINRALYGLPFKVWDNSPYRVSPSLISAVNDAGAPGVSYSFNALQRLISKDLSTGRKLFSTPEELRAFFSTPEMSKALEGYIPTKELSYQHKAGLTSSEADEKALRFAMGNRKKFINLLEDVYFPKSGTDQVAYTRSLQALEDFMARNVDPDAGDTTARMLRSLSREQRLRIANNPKSALPFRKFLELKGVLSTDESGNIITRTPGARYLLYKTYDPSVKYSEKYRKAAQREAYRLRSAYKKELEKISKLALSVHGSKNTELLSKLYDTVDQISFYYLQPLRGEMPHLLNGIDTSISLDEQLSKTNDSTTTFADVLQESSIGSAKVKPQFRAANRMDDEYSLGTSRNVLDWVRRTIPADATPEQVAEVLRPLADYLDIGYKTGVDIPVTPRVQKAVDMFYDKIVPIIERLSKDPAYANTNLGKVFSKDPASLDKLPKDVAADIKKLRIYLGAPLSYSKHADSEIFKELYSTVVKRYDAKSLSFKPKHGGQEVDDLTKFFSVPRSPSEIIAKLDPKQISAHKIGLLVGQSVKNLDELSYRAYANLYNVLDDLGTDFNSMEALFNKIRKDGVKALTPDELKLYRGYTQEVSKMLSQTPYRVYERNADRFDATTGWQGISDIMYSKYPNTDGRRSTIHLQNPIYARTDKLITRELKQSLEVSKNTRTKFWYTNAELQFVNDYVIPNLPVNVRKWWKPSKEKGLFYFDIPKGDEAYTFQLGMDVDLRPERFQIERFLKSFKGDINNVSTLNLLDYGTLQTASGRKHLTDVASRSLVRMNLIPKKTAKFDDIRKQVFDSTVRSTPKNVSEATETVREYFYHQTPEEIAKEAYEPVSSASAAADEVLEDIAGEMKHFDENGGDGAAGESVFGTRKWRWFKQIKDAIAVSEKNAFRAQRATTRTKEASDLGRRIADLTRRLYERSGLKDLKRFYILRQQEVGDVIKGSDFWTEFRRTGMLAAPYVVDSKQLPIVEAALTKNAETLNRILGEGTVEVVTKDYNTTRKIVVMRFTGAKDTVNRVRRAQKALDAAKFEDVVFLPPTALSEADKAFMLDPDMRELSGYMDELQHIAEDQAKFLGFQFDNITPYTHHTMRRNNDTAMWLKETFYDKIDSDSYDDITKLISNLDGYRKTDRGAFGTIIQGKRFRGDYWLFDNASRTIFSYDPQQIFTSTLADGIFANLQYQDFTDLFINDNFKIKGWFKTPEDLKKVLYAKDSKGRLSGNLANSELVSYKLDENGRIVGLIKYDKTTDAGLARALADENTILVPSNAVSHMDNVLRKDVRMSNKFWTFINKHFTIPFKFGLLSNPGFLLGNVSDSTFKLATTMSQKYGTTFTEEAAKVAECINASQSLKNSYYEAFDIWRKVSAEFDIKLSPEATVPDIVAMSPKYKEDFLKWLDGTLVKEFTYYDEAGNLITELRNVPCELPQNVINDASIWTMLQGMQMSSNKLREFADIAEISPTSDFDAPTNWFDRITQGSGKYDKKNFKTWGLFMNNPAMKALTDASSGWEDIIRTASILDDIRHGEYSMDDFAKFARGSAGTEDSIKLSVRLDEAKNTMFNAQFDYERQSDFISRIGKTVPFPIFFLKNFEYWMELFDKNPQFVDNVIDVQEGLWSGYNEDNDKFMTEAKGRGAIPVGGDALPDWFKGVYKPSPLQSMFGAFSLLNDPIDNLSYRVNPLIGGAKAAATSLLPDSDLTTYLEDPESVKYRPYSGDMYERNIKQGDPNFDPLNYTLHRMNPFDRAISSQMRIPAKWEAGEVQLSDALPSVFQPMF